MFFQPGGSGDQKTEPHVPVKAAEGAPEGLKLCAFLGELIALDTRIRLRGQSGQLPKS